MVVIKNILNLGNLGLFGLAFGLTSVILFKVKLTTNNTNLVVKLRSGSGALHYVDFIW